MTPLTKLNQEYLPSLEIEINSFSPTLLAISTRLEDQYQTVESTLNAFEQKINQTMVRKPPDSLLAMMSIQRFSVIRYP